MRVAPTGFVDEPYCEKRYSGSGMVECISTRKTLVFASADQRTDPDPISGKTSYYYARGEQADGELVWVSPMWVDYQPNK